MLTTLIIKDFAIIDRLEIHLGEGMTVLTGETGAGKSIVISALNLLLGGRASTDVIRTASDEAVVEGAFSLGERRASLLPRLDELGIRCEDDGLVVRRVVSRTGRNKVIINGSLATVSTLRELMRGAVDISGQHEHYSLLDVSGHVALLDRFAGLEARSAALATQIRELDELGGELEALRERARDRLARIDYLSYQLNELDTAGLEAGEEEALEQELDRLSHAEALRSATRQGLHELYEDEGSVSERLGSISSMLSRHAGHLPELESMVERLEEARTLVDDVVYELRDLDDLDDDPQRIDEVQSRLKELDLLKRKFGCSIEELIEEAAAMRAELDELSGAETRIEELEARHEALAETVLEEARALSEARHAHATALEGAIERELAPLGMAECVVEVEIDTGDGVEDLRPGGLDRVEFLLAPNPGERAKPLARIASGGELSRTMLAIKQVFASTDDVATYVFDEVDAGIGGTVAEQVGRALRKVSREHQVLCITHLASIASYASSHFAVTKRVVDGERTLSEIRRLGEEERVREIARMLGGLSITERSLEHAAEMVQRAKLPAK